jgi:hypothetical protein
MAASAAGSWRSSGPGVACCPAPRSAGAARARQIFMGGRQTIVMHNTCEDSLLAAPIILDLVILAELLQRIQARAAAAAAAGQPTAP